MANKIDILVVEPCEAPRPIQVEDTLEAFQQIVGGPIEAGSRVNALRVRAGTLICAQLPQVSQVYLTRPPVEAVALTISGFSSAPERQR